MRVMVLGRPRWTVATISLVVAVALVAAWSIGRAAAAPGAVLGAPDPGAGTGIEVHGDWTVDVYEPDGVLAASHSFQNALLMSGERFLAALLSGEGALEEWYITWGCDGAPGTTDPDTCVIAEPDAVKGPDYFTTEYLGIVQADATLTRDTADQARTLVLEGSASAPADHTVDWVGTSVCCRIADTLDLAASESPFTSRELSPGIEVLEGQQVVIRVELSFS